MIKRILLTCFILCFLSGFTSKVFAQDTVRANQVLFTEAYLGVAYLPIRSFSAGVNFNYQIKKHLLSARFYANSYMDMDVVTVFFIFPVPVLRESISTGEYSVLYGLRKVLDNKSISLSGGFSFNQYSAIKRITGDEYTKKKDFYFGIPLEANFKFFQKEKQRYRIYGLFPVGQPTGFGRSIGFKLFGNISKNSYIGAGLSYGFGFHKKY